MNKVQLENRLIDFSVAIIQMTETLNTSYTAQHLSKQIIRSGTSISLNYGEAQSGESTKDFIHKIYLVLKELRETQVCLKIIERAGLLTRNDTVRNLQIESNELISIFVATINKTRKNYKI